MLNKTIDAFLADGNPPPVGAGIFGGLCSAEDASLLLLPVPWEPTTSYGQGTAEAPAGVLAASHFLDLEDLAFGRPYLAGVHMLAQEDHLARANHQAREVAHESRRSELGSEHRAELRALVNRQSKELNRWVYETASKALARGQFVGLVGGDHSSPYGLIQALDERHPSFGILHIDAHMDLRKAYEGFEFSHASIMRNVHGHCRHLEKLVQVGIRDFSAEEKQYADSHPKVIEVVYDRDLFRGRAEGITFAGLAKDIIAALPEHVYISFDIDGLDPRYCPGTGTPVPGGLDFSEACYILEELVASGRQVIGFDLCEVARAAGESEWDFNVGARILYKLCGTVIASASRER